jgi:hypothetical protein
MWPPNRIVLSAATIRPYLKQQIRSRSSGSGRWATSGLTAGTPKRALSRARKPGRYSIAAAIVVTLQAHLSDEPTLDRLPHPLDPALVLR